MGILAGAKLGSLAAIGGSILGYTGASIIREQREVRRLLAQPPPAPAQEVTAPVRKSQRRRKSVRLREEPRKEEEEVGEVLYPPHLHTSQWRQLQHKTEQSELTNQQSILALIGPGGEAEPGNTLLVTAVVSALPDSHKCQQ